MATFSEFNGKDVQRVKVRTGYVVFLSYQIEARKGELAVVIREGNEALWQKTYAGTNANEALQFAAKKDGEFRIVTEGRRADGEFHFRFRTSAPKKIEVKTSRNIELFALLMQLDLAPDALANNDVVDIAGRKARWRDWYALAVQNYERYKDFADGRMMKSYRDHLARGFYNDFFIGLLLQVPEVPHARITDETDEDLLRAFSKSGDLVEAKREAQKFLDELNAFYTEIGFEAYMNEKRGDYETIKNDVTKNLPPPAVIATMEQFYRTNFKGYCLVPSLNIPTTMGFGKTHRKAGIVYNTFGPFGFQTFTGKTDLAFDFPDKIRGLSVHEFGHSFVNPSVDRLPEELIKNTGHLYEPLRAQMTSQGYPNWRICLYEHFVRAGEVVIARKLGNANEAEDILKHNAAGGFVYLPFIVAELEQFDRDLTNESYDDAVRTTMEKLAKQEK